MQQSWKVCFHGVTEIRGLGRVMEGITNLWRMEVGGAEAWVACLSQCFEPLFAVAGVMQNSPVAVAAVAAAVAVGAKTAAVAAADSLAGAAVAVVD